jgi:hypothetical protein
MDKKYYYELRLLDSEQNGYSRFFESSKYLDRQNEIINEAIKIMPHIKKT